MHTDRQPTTTDRPMMPGYGLADSPEGLLPWSWAVKRLRDAHAYWVATQDADGAPHLAAVWGVWLDDVVYFATGGRTRKARNLDRDPRCALTPGDATESVVLTGRARRITDEAELEQVTAVYVAKYGEGFPDPQQNPVFAVGPTVVVGLDEATFTASATRWRLAD